MDTVFKALFFRQPLIHYVSPPICENIFSSSGGPVIVLNAMNKLFGITGLVQGGLGNFWLLWGSYQGAICYSVYKSTDPNDPEGTYVIVAECIPNPEFDLTGEGSGYYVVTAITPEGETPFSDPFYYNAPSCPVEVGDPAPEDFNITSEVVWDTVAMTAGNTYVWPTNPDFFCTDFPGDYPPGIYAYNYVRGFRDVSGACPMGTFQGNTWFLLFDDDFNWDVSGAPIYGSMPIFWFAPVFAFFGNGVTSLSGCQANFTDVQSYFDSLFNAPGTLKRFYRIAATHSNEGGTMTFVSVDASHTLVPGFEPSVTLVQVSGLIQQPRSLEIIGWSTAKAPFPSEVKDNWNGVFDARTTYTEDTCVWDAASNPLYSAQISYMASGNPRHASGRGWKLEIYSLGVTLVWRGYKGVGDTGAGEYYAEAGHPVTALPCVLVEEV